MDYKSEHYQKAIKRLNQQLDAMEHKILKSEETISLLKMTIETMDSTNGILNKLLRVKSDNKINGLVTQIRDHVTPAGKQNPQIDKIVENEMMNYFRELDSLNRSWNMPAKEEE